MSIRHVFAGEVISVLPLRERIAESKTSALFKAVDLEVIRIVLRKGKSLPEHTVPGEITLQCLEGCLDLRMEPGTLRMKAGDFVHLLGGQPHSLLAIQDSSALLTVSLRQGNKLPAA